MTLCTPGRRRLRLRGQSLATAASARAAAVEVDVLANDVDPDGEGDLQVAIITPASTPPSRFRRRPGHVGDRSIALIYEVTDEGGAAARAVVSIPVMDRRPPVCETRTVDVKAGDSVRVPVLDACQDPGGGDLELVQVVAERGGAAQPDGSEVVFTAAADVRGDAGFSYLVSNGTTNAFGGVIVRVAGQDFPPDFAATDVELPAGGSRSIDLAALVTDLNAEDTHTFSSLRGHATSRSRRPSRAPCSASAPATTPTAHPRR